MKKVTESKVKSKYIPLYYYKLLLAEIVTILIEEVL